MFRIIYHGPDRADYTRIQAGLPKHYRVTPIHSRSRLESDILRHRPHGMILPLKTTAPADLRYLRNLLTIPGVPGIVVTADHISVQQAVCCMRIGACDCIGGSPDGRVLGVVLDRMVKGRPEYGRGSSCRDSHFVGDSPPARDLKEKALRYAETSHPILITGETGTGKELIARFIHENSLRKDGPFMAVNCAAVPDDLLGTELFGSRTGAFTGSVDRPGLFEAARGGTLFLDEIGELSLRGQASLLRVIEEKTVRRMGSLHPVEVDVRILAATNRPLRQLMKENLFRQDLYYRLNLLGLVIPPLRKRREDIPEIARSYLASVGCSLVPESNAMAALLRHPWPGNVRELHSVLLKAGLSGSDGLIRAGDLSFS